MPRRPDPDREDFRADYGNGGHDPDYDYEDRYGDRASDRADAEAEAQADREDAQQPSNGEE